MGMWVRLRVTKGVYTVVDTFTRFLIRLRLSGVTAITRFVQLGICGQRLSDCGADSTSLGTASACWDGVAW